MNTKILITVVMVAGMLGACSTSGKKNYVAEQTYAATEQLVAGTNAVVNQTTPMLVGTLTDVDYIETSNTFGRIVAEQVSSRLSQMGYNVTELKMRNSLNIKRGVESPWESGEFIISRDVNALQGRQKAAAAVTGTYALAGKDIIVNLKLLDVATGKIINSVDYTLPLNDNTRGLMDMNSAAAGGNFYGSSMFY